MMALLTLLQIAYIGPEKTDRGWFILPSLRTEGENRVVPPESVQKSPWKGACFIARGYGPAEAPLASISIIDHRVNRMTHVSSRMLPEWWIKNGVCYFKGFLILRAVKTALPPPEGLLDG